MELNSLFTKGHEHKVCQDYALHGSSPFPYIMIADGSSSSLQSEVGSKIVTLSAQKVLNESTLKELTDITSQELGNRIIYKSNYIIEQLGLPSETLDSTLVLGFLHKEKNKFIVHAFGDGVIIYKKDSQIYYQSINYSENYPFYLSYNLNNSRKKALLENIQQTMTVSFSKLGNEKTINREQPVYKSHTLEIGIDNLEWVCIASDGIESFNEDIEETINKISAFKNFKGVFLERRLNKIIKENKKDNIDHYDDLSLAAIYMGENDENS